jgi:hypothetical protein
MIETGQVLPDFYESILNDFTYILFPEHKSCCEAGYIAVVSVNQYPEGGFVSLVGHYHEFFIRDCMIGAIFLQQLQCVMFLSMIRHKSGKVKSACKLKLYPGNFLDPPEF